MKKFEYEGRKWHEECFQCDECHQPIRDQKFAPSDERVICVRCYEEAYAPRCHNCKGVSYFRFCLECAAACVARYQASDYFWGRLLQCSPDADNPHATPLYKSLTTVCVTKLQS